MILQGLCQNRHELAQMRAAGGVALAAGSAVVQANHVLGVSFHAPVSVHVFRTPFLSGRVGASANLSVFSGSGGPVGSVRLGVSRIRRTVGRCVRRGLDLSSRQPLGLRVAPAFVPLATGRGSRRFSGLRPALSLARKAHTDFGTARCAPALHAIMQPCAASMGGAGLCQSQFKIIAKTKDVPCSRRS